MKALPSRPPAALPRRGLLAGAGAAGALATAAAVLPAQPAGTDVGPAVDASGPQGPSEGYRLTAHVKAYYRSTRI